MDELLRKLEELKCGPVGKIVEKSSREFENIGKSSSHEIFKELCFCLLTANFNAKKSIDIQEKIGDGFITLPEEELARELKKMGHRYPSARAHYIVEARVYSDSIKKILSEFRDDFEAREWLVENILGLGYKESSHFLRNIGHKNLAIIDFHIVDILAANKLIEPPKSRCLTKKKYLEIEKVIGTIGAKLGLSQGKLDQYLWYLETKTVLK